ncbi:MAG: metallophosphoesterase [Burkholderiales bacterium]
MTRCLRRFRWLPLLLPGVVAGCLDSGDAPFSSPDDVRHAYVVVGANGQAVARAITAAGNCPAISIDGARPVPMSLRAPAASLPPRPTAYDKHNTVPAVFPVTVCDTVLPAGARRAAIGARSLPVPAPQPRRILLIGDTGCRMKASGDSGEFQACNDGLRWPFATVAFSAAAQAPDLVLHVGDLHYRESACPPGDAGCQGSPFGFSWTSWEPDFFAPAAPLLAAAPWIFVRGDHETCDRAGQGWWRMIDPRPLVPGQDCNDAANDDVGNYSEPYAVPFAGDSAFVVFDSSVVGNKKLKPSDAQFQLYRRQFETAFSLGAPFANAFFANHHPVLGYNSGGTTQAEPGNEALQSVLETIVPGFLFPANVQAVLSGHVHLLQIVGYATGQPPTFIPGNGGTALVPNFTSYPKGDTPLPGAVVASLLHAPTFGFMTLERAAPGWTLASYDRNGALLTTCGVVAKKATCSPATLPAGAAGGASAGYNPSF